MDTRFTQLLRNRLGIVFTRKLNTLLLILTLLTAATIPAAAQVGIGTTNPDPSAILDLQASNQGMLFPRVALTGAGDTTTVPDPATSLVVYNTATAGNITPGFYYWNGAAWASMASPVGHTDVNASDKDVLLYDATTSQWKAAPKEEFLPAFQIPSLLFVAESTQTFYTGNNGSIKVPAYNGDVYNPSGALDNVVGEFVVQETGYYDISANAVVGANNSGTGGFFITSVSKGGLAMFAVTMPNGWTPEYPNIRYVGRLEAGDHVYVAAGFCNGCAASQYYVANPRFTATRLY